MRKYFVGYFGALMSFNAVAFGSDVDTTLNAIVPPLCLQQAQTAFGKSAEVTLDATTKDLLIRVDIDQRCQMVLANSSTQQRQILWPEIKEGLEEIYRRNALWLQNEPQYERFFDTAVVGSTASTASWLVLQHSDSDPKWQKRMIPRLKKLAFQGRFQKDHLALLIDRVAVNSGRPQPYGSQGKCGSDGLWHPKPIADAGHVDNRRIEVGLLPMADNIRRFVC